MNGTNAQEPQKNGLAGRAIRRAMMDLFTDSIQRLTAMEKLRLVERIWDDLAAQEAPFPLPDWAVREAARRRDEIIADPHLGMTPGEMWARIASSRNGSPRNA